MFPVPHHSEQAKLVEMILGCESNQSIFLLGSTTIQKRTSSIFNAEQPSCRYNSHYFIVTVTGNDSSPLASLQDKIENHLLGYVPCTVLVFGLKQFNEWVSQGHSFACAVLKKALQLHVNADHDFEQSVPAGPISSIDSRKQSLRKGLSMAEEFVAGSELYRLRKQYGIAAFMLHQAGEDALKSLLEYSCGLRANTHNLDKLVRYCSMSVWKITEIFRRETASDVKLFNQLQQAYIDARYRDFNISESSLDVLSRKIKELIALARSISEQSR